MKKEELKEMGLTSYEKLKICIEQGDKSKALHLLDEIIKNRESNRHWFMDLIDLLLIRLAEKAGEEEIYKLLIDLDHLRSASGAGLFGNRTKLSPEEVVKTRARTWTASHAVPIELEEDHEKFTLTIPCPTGGRLRRKAEYGKTRKPHPWSHGEAGFCLYCAHCITFFEMIAIEKFGYPLWVNNPLSKPEGTCQQTIYKDPKFVPEEVYKRVGKEKGRTGPAHMIAGKE